MSEDARIVKDAADTDGLIAVSRLLAASRRTVVLSGAGCSTESGIPDYRGPDGEWKRRQPVRYGDFIRKDATRQRYWARSFTGWPAFRQSRPNGAHAVLARWEAAGRVHHTITQNVDELHQSAGSERVVDLHGRLGTVRCLDCERRTARDLLQERMHALNPGWEDVTARAAPDGDADLEGDRIATFRVPDCADCGGMLKPDVVFFGESVPPDRVTFAMDRVAEADLLLVVGSSLMVWSGYRFAKAAAEAGTPVAILN
ncbi:MAG: NAD-dependent protein deacetylase, partial [Gemmatimonadetes bacterium]|nr:NAD-dependent protein deacetylase [Gemmatimonadota bacterium]